MPSLKKSVAWLLILVPVFTFFWYFFRYTVNIPVNDDYPAILLFLNNYLSSSTLHEKLSLLFAQHNEHRIVYCRLCSLIYYKLTGQVNFNGLSFIGNLSLVGIGAIFLVRSLRLKKSIFLFIPVTVLLFNLTSSENMLYTMCALGNFTVHLFILLCLLLLSSSTPSSDRNIWLGLLFFTLAVFTIGAGITLLPVSAGILLYKKSYRQFWIYGIIASVILASYFIGYFKPPNTGDPITALLYYKVRTIDFFFGFLGGAFNYFLIHSNGLQASLNLCSMTGLCFFVLFIHITRQGYYRKNLFNYSIMVMVVLTAAVAAMARAPMDLDIAAHSRYRINGIIFFIALYFWFIETYRVETTKALTAILGVTAWYYLVINLGQSEYLPFRQQNNYLEIMCTKAGAPSIVFPDSAEVVRQRGYLQRSAELNIYHLPSDAEVDHYIPQAVKAGDDGPLTESKLDMVQHVLRINKIGNDYLIEGMAFLMWKSAKHQRVFVGLQHEGDSLPVYFTSKAMSRFDLNPYFHQSNLEKGGYWARIPVSEVPPGENKIWIKLEVDGQVKVKETEAEFIK